MLHPRHPSILGIAYSFYWIYVSIFQIWRRCWNLYVDINTVQSWIIFLQMKLIVIVKILFLFFIESAWNLKQFSDCINNTVCRNYLTLRVTLNSHLEFSSEALCVFTICFRRRKRHVRSNAFSSKILHAYVTSYICNFSVLIIL